MRGFFQFIRWSVQIVKHAIVLLVTGRTLYKMLKQMKDNRETVTRVDVQPAPVYQ